MSGLRSLRSILIVCSCLVGAWWFSRFAPSLVWWFYLAGTGLLIAGIKAYVDIEDRQFQNKRYAMLWKNVRDRLGRFDSAYRGMKNAWDEELPVLRERVRYTADVVYEALRRADVMQAEVSKSEGHMQWNDSNVLQPSAPPIDKKVQELYQLADRNVAEYRQRLNAVTAGIQRCEAQTTVFITTLDSLRVRLLGYRLMGKSPEIEHQAFLETIGEAKQQLDAVDKALEEISFERLVAQMELEASPPRLPQEANITEEH